MRRRSLSVAILLAVLFAFGLPRLASSAPADDPRAEREQVRAERARVAAQIDTSKASLDEIDAALTVLEENLATQEAALDRTEAELAQAVKDVADAQSAIETLTGQIGALKIEMRDRAVAAFVNPPGDDMLTVLEANDFTTASAQRFYLGLRAQDDADLSDQLQGATEDLEHEKAKATEAEARAKDKLAEQQVRTDAVRAAEADQQQLADSLQASIDAQVARSLQLAATDRTLSAQIAQEQAALAARLAAIQAAQHAQQQASSAGSSSGSSSSGSSSNGGSSGSSSSGNQDAGGGETTALPPVSSGSSAGSSGAGVSLCTVGGITVNCRIKTQLQNLLNAARADGLALSGGGYRDPAAQIALREAHCGTSQYAIYEMPASQCSPPTAKPGQSQHELGLAIDFSNCTSRSSACYKWLAANAGSFGFYNLPSEPWHWSTTGN